MYSNNQSDRLITFKCQNNNECFLKVMNVGGNDSHINFHKKLEVRNEEVLSLRNKFPNKIPIIIKRFSKEAHLPHLDKCKYLVPQEITMSQFQTIIRNRMHMNPNQALYLLVNNRSMLSLSLTLAEVYQDHAGPDGFLYITYASQEVFGSMSSL